MELFRTNDRQLRFRFGENWQSFLSSVDERSIAEAETGLRRLIPVEELRGRRFLDIGCGSGLSALAALRLGAAAVDAIDIDPLAVAATEALLSRFAAGAAWTVQRRDVLKLDAHGQSPYDIVYSWGVLHHTGAMVEAIACAASLVGPGGILAIALYRRTPLCFLWRMEKRFYAQAGPRAQALATGFYKALYRTALLLTGRNPARYFAGYKSARGMDWHHDVHDWLGGYPYESTEPRRVLEQLKELGFAPRVLFEHRAAALGIFGSHCDEYVAVRGC